MIEKNSQWGPSGREVTKSASFQILEIFAWFTSLKSELKHEISFKTIIMDLKCFTTEELISLFKRRSVPQEALDLLRGKLTQSSESSLRRQSNISANTFGFLKL